MSTQSSRKWHFSVSISWTIPAFLHSWFYIYIYNYALENIHFYKVKWKNIDLGTKYFAANENYCCFFPCKHIFRTLITCYQPLIQLLGNRLYHLESVFQSFMRPDYFPGDLDHRLLDLEVGLIQFALHQPHFCSCLHLASSVLPQLFGWLQVLL